jgi:Uma2 family endonuclease
MLPEPSKTITREAYLSLERKAELKSEFVDGDVFAMAGASREHNLIAANIVRVLGNQMLDRPCNFYPSDMKVRIERMDAYTYPDIAIACDPEIFEDDHRDVLMNPLAIMEILSESTEAYDRGRKFAHYQFIPSFIEYILISQLSPRVERFVRQNDGTWIYSIYGAMGEIVPVGSVNCELPVSEIYRKIGFKN